MRLAFSNRNRKPITWEDARATSQANALNKGLWRGLAGALPISLGKAGSAVINQIDKRDKPIFVNFGTANPWKGTEIGNCLDCDGTNDYIQSAGASGEPNFYNSVMKGRDLYSIMIWIKFRSLANLPAFMSVNASGQWFLEVSSTLFYWRCGGGAGLRTWTLSTGLANDTWYNFVITKTGATTGFLYVNGQEETSSVGTLQATTNTNYDFHIGSYHTGAQNFSANALIGDVLAWNRPLTSAEALQLYRDPQAIWRPSGEDIIGKSFAPAVSPLRNLSLLGVGI